MTAHNSTHTFNFVESGFYNHVRDLLALSLVIVKNSTQNNSVRVLDYGSNPSPWADLRNKIDLESIKLKIYDPYLASRTPASLSEDIGIELVETDDRACIDEKFDIVVWLCAPVR
jgi:hypothetical protein